MATVLITGANRGIGLALSSACRKRGDHVVAVCRNASPELRELNVQIETGVDVIDQDSLVRLNAALDEIRIDVLINCAGVLKRQTLEDLDAENLAAMQHMYLVNSIGPLLVTRTLLDHLCPGSKVIIITSRMGSIADNDTGGHYGYRMSKAAVNCAGVSMAHDLKPKGISVQLLHPGWVKTDMGGENALIDAAESACGLLARIDELDLQSSGCFRHVNGENLPW